MFVCFARDTQIAETNKTKQKKRTVKYFDAIHAIIITSCQMFDIFFASRLSVLVNLSDFSRTQNVCVYIYKSDARISVLQIFEDVL